MFKYQLGDQVKDRVAGFTGVVTSRTEFLNGCIRYGVSPRKLKDDGSVIDAVWFDEAQLDFLNATEMTVQHPVRTDESSPHGESRTGGPQPNPQRPADPPTR